MGGLDLSLDLPLGILTAVLTAVGGRLVLGLTWLHRETLPFQRRLFLIAFAARFAVSLGLYVGGGASIIGDDDSLGWIYGNTIRNEWESASMGLLDVPTAWLRSFEGNHQGYYYLVATLFFVLNGTSRLAAAALNCGLGALSVVLAYRLARVLFTESVAIRVGWWTCLFPSMIIWSAQTIKEPSVILLETLALYGATALRRADFSPRHIMLCIAAIIMVIPFRFYAAYIGAGAIALSALGPTTQHRKWSVSGIVVGIALVASMGLLAQREARFELYDIEFVQAFRYNIADAAGSGVYVPLDVTTSTGFGVATLVGAAHLLLAPFPWQLFAGSVRMLLVGPEAVYWYWLFFVALIPGIRWALRERLGDVLPLLFFIVGLGLLYSVMFGNIGLIYRQRAQLLPWLLVFASVGVELRRAKRAAGGVAAVVPPYVSPRPRGV